MVKRDLSGILIHPGSLIYYDSGLTRFQTCGGIKIINLRY